MIMHQDNFCVCIQPKKGQLQTLLSSLQENYPQAFIHCDDSLISLQTRTSDSSALSSAIQRLPEVKSIFCEAEPEIPRSTITPREIRKLEWEVTFPSINATIEVRPKVGHDPERIKSNLSQKFPAGKISFENGYIRLTIITKFVTDLIEEICKMSGVEEACYA